MWGHVSARAGPHSVNRVISAPYGEAAAPDAETLTFRGRTVTMAHLSRNG